MGLAVLPPDPEDEYAPIELDDEEEDSDESMGAGDERPSKRRRMGDSSGQIALPGEVITEDAQWMR
jgi:hypothetical protein